MWINSNKSFKINEEIQRKNVEILNREISRFYEEKHDRQKRRKELERIEEEIRLEIAANVSAGKAIRTVSELIDDGIFTLEELLNLKTLEGYGKRVRALIEVLRALPEGDYKNLKEMFQDGKVLVQIPDERLAGSLVRVAGYKHCTLYLAPTLESHPYSYVKSVVGHELAHLLLHSDFSMKKRIGIAEKEAELKSKEWGF